MLEKILYCSAGTLVIGAVLLLGSLNVNAGFLYVLNERDGQSNRIYGYRVNEVTGALTPLAWSPLSTNGNGATSTSGDLMAIDRTNQRLYVVNNGTVDISAYSIDPVTGDLTRILDAPPFATLGIWNSISVHPLGSPLMLGRSDPASVAAYRITPLFATRTGIIPESLSAQPFSSTFSRDGTLFYTGGDNSTSLASVAVNPVTGNIRSVPGAPFEVGGAVRGLSSDSAGRLFAGFFPFNRTGGFTTLAGVPTPLTGNPFDPGTSSQISGEIHPNENFYYTSSASTAIAALQITDSGSSTTLTPVAGSPFNTGGGTGPNAMAFNNAGTFLFTANSGTRNITIHSVNPTTGVLTFQSIQAANSVGTSGGLSGMAYMPGLLTVTNTSNSGTGSLREALGLAGVASVGVIKFDPTVFSTPKTISLSTVHLTIGSNLHIVGPGARLLTIRNVAAQSATSRVFLINNGATVTLSGLTIAGGNVSGLGGGISNDGNSNSLTLFNCHIDANKSTSVGGGIYNRGALNIVNSTISNNTAVGGTGGGGGVDNIGYLNVVNSTISGNVKTGSSLNGAGIWTNDSLVIMSSTIANNFTDSGASGVHSPPAAASVVKNTIIARNKGAMADVEGSFQSGGHNIIGKVGSATGFPGTGDQIGTFASPLDPKVVNVLAYNGGNAPTHALLPGSPAVDNGTGRSHIADERYVSRPVDNAGVPNLDDGSDIGAFERRARESIFTAPFDFDGDNKTDIAIFRAGTAEWWINRSSDASTFATQFGTITDHLVPGDYTGDGKCDIAVWRSSTGAWLVLRSDDFSFFSFPFGRSGDIPAPADFDGDAKADPAVYRSSVATWFILNSSGGTTIQQFGALGDLPVPGDYDGDGRDDLAIYREQAGQWWINRSSEGIIAVPFGSPVDKPVPGDYTGDGKIDVAFWRPSTGEWFILRSEDFSFFAFPFGADGDRLAPGDYDGDGKCDATVFRPSGATWFSQRSSAGTLIQQFGVPGDRPVANAFVN